MTTSDSTARQHPKFWGHDWDPGREAEAPAIEERTRQHVRTACALEEILREHRVVGDLLVPIKSAVSNVRSLIDDHPQFDAAVTRAATCTCPGEMGELLHLLDCLAVGA